MNDVGALNQSIGATFQKIIVEPINIFTISLLLFIISWKLMLIALFIIPFSQFIMQDRPKYQTQGKKEYKANWWNIKYNH